MGKFPILNILEFALFFAQTTRGSDTCDSNFDCINTTSRYCCRDFAINSNRSCRDVLSCVGRNCRSDDDCGGQCCGILNRCRECSKCSSNANCVNGTYCCGAHQGQCRRNCSGKYCVSHVDCGRTGLCCISNNCVNNGCLCASIAGCITGMQCCLDSETSQCLENCTSNDSDNWDEDNGVSPSTKYTVLSLLIGILVVFFGVLIFYVVFVLVKYRQKLRCRRSIAPRSFQTNATVLTMPTTYRRSNSSDNEIVPVFYPWQRQQYNRTCISEV